MKFAAFLRVRVARELPALLALAAVAAAFFLVGVR